MTNGYALSIRYQNAAADRQPRFGTFSWQIFAKRNYFHKFTFYYELNTSLPWTKNCLTFVTHFKRR